MNDLDSAQLEQSVAELDQPQRIRHIASDLTEPDSPAALVEAELRQRGFEILSRDDRFIDQPGDEPWWLLVARRP